MLDDLATLQEEIQHKDAQLESLTREVNNYMQRAQCLEQELDVAEDQMTEFKSNRADLQEQIQNANHIDVQRQQLTQELENLQEENKDLRMELNASIARSVQGTRNDHFQSPTRNTSIAKSIGSTRS